MTVLYAFRGYAAQRDGPWYAIGVVQVGDTFVLHPWSAKSARAKAIAQQPSVFATALAATDAAAKLARSKYNGKTRAYQLDASASRHSFADLTVINSNLNQVQALVLADVQRLLDSLYTAQHDDALVSVYTTSVPALVYEIEPLVHATTLRAWMKTPMRTIWMLVPHIDMILHVADGMIHTGRDGDLLTAFCTRIGAPVVAVTTPSTTWIAYVHPMGKLEGWDTAAALGAVRSVIAGEGMPLSTGQFVTDVPTMLRHVNHWICPVPDAAHVPIAQRSQWTRVPQVAELLRMV